MKRPVMDWLAQHKNVTVTVEEIAKALNADRQQVLNAFSGLRADGVVIEAIVRGSTYVYREKPIPETPLKNGRRVFEEIGTTRDGTSILQDEDGTLYRASELT